MLLTIFRWYVFDGGRKRIDLMPTVIRKFALGGSGVMFKADARSTRHRGSNRAFGETTATVGTHIVENSFYTVRTKRAFISTNARFRGVRREVFVAEFAVWTKFQHFVTSLIR